MVRCNSIFFGRLLILRCNTYEGRRVSLYGKVYIVFMIDYARYINNLISFMVAGIIVEKASLTSSSSREMWSGARALIQ